MNNENDSSIPKSRVLLRFGWSKGIRKPRLAFACPRVGDDNARSMNIISLMRRDVPFSKQSSSDICSVNLPDRRKCGIVNFIRPGFQNLIDLFFSFIRN